MRSFILLAGILCTIFCTAQKPALTIADTKKWTAAVEGKISDNGNWICYTVIYQPPGSNTLVIRSTINNWEKKIPGATDAVFANDKWILYKLKDSLVVFELGSKETAVIPSIREFATAKDNLIYRSGTDGKLSIRNLITNKQEDYASVKNYFVDPTGSKILLEKQDAGDAELQLIDIASMSSKKIWSGRDVKPLNYSWNKNGDQLIFFLGTNKGTEKHFDIGYYKNGASSAEITPVDFSNADADRFTLSANRTPEFSVDGRLVFLYLQSNPPVYNQNPDAAKVNIWSYQDSVLQSRQLKEIDKKYVYAATFDVEKKTITRLEQTNEKMEQKSAEYGILERRLGLDAYFEAGWNRKAQSDFYVISFKNGLRKLLKSGVVNHAERPQLSPNGKWAVYYDLDTKNYSSYETASGKTRIISVGLNDNWETTDDHLERSVGGIAWLAGGDKLIVYDGYDLWLLDPSAVNKGKNLTNGFGRRNGIAFRILDSEHPVNKNNEVILTAFDKKSKDAGFYAITLDKPADPELLSMGPYVYQSFENYTMFWPPHRAQNADVYLDQRCSAGSAPNYFVTRDFKHFDMVSDFQPQKKFNWYTTELHSWKSLDGTTLQGILYKPEDFDPRKKYPVIFQYYEKKSQQLNLYIHPTASEHEINIPMFVSNGYLVFVPDIHYKIGETGKSAYNAVVAAANYLSQKPWVDAAKMGLQGHSFGGFETGYIITHTKMFAAACSAAGIYDLISEYDNGSRYNYPMYHKERGQGRFGKSLWEMQSAYIENSSILRANQITTPVLMMHNQGDNNVLFTQGLEFFNALRRLGKRAWMLDYDNGGHSIDYGKDAEDYHTRMIQFFDHYLKGKPAPLWMTRGIPARLKGVEDGLEYDDVIKTPGPGLLLKKR